MAKQRGKSGGKPVANSNLANQYAQFAAKEKSPGGAEAAKNASAYADALAKIERTTRGIDAAMTSLADGSAKKFFAAQLDLERAQERLARAEQFARWQAQYGQVGARVLQLQQFVGRLADASARLGRQFAAAGTGLASGLLAPVASLAGLASGISQGTIEGDRLALAMTYLKRVLVDDLAPYVRILTQGIIELAGWCRACAL